MFCCLFSINARFAAVSRSSLKPVAATVFAFCAFGKEIGECIAAGMFRPSRCVDIAYRLIEMLILSFSYFAGLLRQHRVENSGSSMLWHAEGRASGARAPGRRAMGAVRTESPRKVHFSAPLIAIWRLW